VSEIQGMFINSQKEIQMMKKGKSIIAVLAMIALIVGLSGCAKEGPMERAGKKVDKAVEDIRK
jgi:predicted small lipoprotein YifL